MIEARQMQNPMKRQDLHFHGGGVTETGSILTSDVSRNCDFSGELLSSVCIRRKRKHVGSFVFLSKLKIQRPHFCAAGQQDVHPAPQVYYPARSQHESLESGRA